MLKKLFCTKQIVFPQIRYKNLQYFILFWTTCSEFFSCSFLSFSSALVLSSTFELHIFFWAAMKSRVSISQRNDYCVDRAILALPSTLQEYLLTLKLIKKLAEQRARLPSGHTGYVQRSRLTMATFNLQMATFKGFCTIACAPVKKEC